MSHAHDALHEIFADLHVEGRTVRATLLHDPTVQGLDMAIYIDGSASMIEEYRYPPEAQAAPAGHARETVAAEPAPAKKRGWLARLFGWGDADHDDDHGPRPKGGVIDTPHAAPAPDDHDGDDDDDHHGARGRPGDNQVEPQVRRMLQYLATKDRNGRLRVAYWACGGHGKDVEVIGELTGAAVEGYKFPGPKLMGGGTYLAPAIRDYLRYHEEQCAQGATRGCAVFVTDGRIGDAFAVETLSADVAGRIGRGELAPTNFILVGVGDQVDEEQMEKICHREYAGSEHLWCHRIAEEIDRMAELVAVLVDETMTVAPGGVVYDERGSVVQRYEGRLPAVLEFQLPAGATRFTLEIAGKRYDQELPEDEH